MVNSKEAPDVEIATTTDPEKMDIMEIVKKIQTTQGIVGRTDELRAAVLARLSNRHLLLEGEVGVGKTTLAKAIATYFGQTIHRVDGDQRYTETKLVGYFNPAKVLQKGYSWDTFTAGPLTSAMQKGGVLFLNEINRLPEGTQNTLLPALDERIITLPKLGEVEAKDDFISIATQNPEEHVGVTRLSEAIRDRYTWVYLKHQNKEEEIRITRLRAPDATSQVIRICVAITRATRKHPDISRGASVRAAIDQANLLVPLIKSGHKITRDDWKLTGVMALNTKIQLVDDPPAPAPNLIRSLIDQILNELGF
ncbi:MAG: AAA family ATPase [Candidatus Ranarchaeia archaeon]